MCLSVYLTSLCPSIICTSTYINTPLLSTCLLAPPPRQRPPRILFSHCEIYASTAVLGSAVYIASKAAGLPPGNESSLINTTLFPLWCCCSAIERVCKALDNCCGTATTAIDAGVRRFV